jgi:adhesin/invasin
VITVSSASANQTGTIGLPLAEPISVQVTDQAGNPVANVIVTWTVLTGGGSVATATSTTDGNGNASVIWTLGPTAGENTLRASIATGASVTITATGVAAIGSTMSIVSGDAQTVTLGTTSAPLVAMVSTAQGLGVAGVVVAWTMTGNGTLSAASTTTDANGQTSVTVTPTTSAQTITVTATAAGLTPVTFTITVP